LDKPRFYASAFLWVLSLDALLYVFSEGNRIVNWESGIHSGWVTASALFLLAAAYGPKSWRRLPYALHGLVFAAALLNQFFAFSPILNYQCMLFNLALFTAYFFWKR
jgi:hypothetical protein